MNAPLILAIWISASRIPPLCSVLLHSTSKPSKRIWHSLGLLLCRLLPVAELQGPEGAHCGAEGRKMRLWPRPWVAGGSQRLSFSAVGRHQPGRARCLLLSPLTQWAGAPGSGMWQTSLGTLAGRRAPAELPARLFSAAASRCEIPASARGEAGARSRLSSALCMDVTGKTCFLCLFMPRPHRCCFVLPRVWRRIVGVTLGERGRQLARWAAGRAFLQGSAELSVHGWGQSREQEVKTPMLPQD